VANAGRWICLQLQVCPCSAVSVVHVPDVSCTLADVKQSSSTVKSKLIGLNFRQKSFRIALQIICACGECVSDSALFALHYLKICRWDLYLQLL